MKHITLLGAPMDLGGARRGTDMGPNAVRIAGIEASLRAQGHEFTDLGNVDVPDISTLLVNDESMRYVDEIAESCRKIRDSVAQSLNEDKFPLVVGGDHAIACGTVAGVSDHFARKGESIGLLWFDAHGDMNTPQSSPSGNVHGMPLASCLGRGPDALTRLGERLPLVDTVNTAVVGVRSIDPAEANIIEELGVRVFTTREIDARGMFAVMTEAIDIVTNGTAGFHVSFDVDGSDPTAAPGVGTPEPGGLTYRESHLFMEMAAESQRVVSVEVTEINPILDRGNTTAEFAVEMCCSALGQTVLHR